MDDDEIDIEGDDDMGIGNDRGSIPHHHVHTPSDSFLSELPETSSWILDSLGDWNVDDDQKAKDFHSMLLGEDYFTSSGRHHFSPAKHAHAHHATLVHTSSADSSAEKSDISKKRARTLKMTSSESDEDSEDADSGKKGDGKKARAAWSADEQRLFREGISKFGKDYRKVQIHVGTRTIGQVRSHAQKYFQKQKRTGSPSSAKNIPSSSSPPTTIKSTASGSPMDNEPITSVYVEQVTKSLNLRGVTNPNSNLNNGKHLPSHNTPWTIEEQKAFTEGLGMYGKGNWKIISTHIGSRTPLQVKNHARQYFKKMAKLGVDVEVDSKPKIVVEKKKKQQLEVEQPVQPLISVARTQITKKQYHSADEDEEIDILGEESGESSIESLMNKGELRNKQDHDKQTQIPTVIPAGTLYVEQLDKPQPFATHNSSPNPNLNSNMDPNSNMITNMNSDSFINPIPINLMTHNTAESCDPNEITEPNPYHCIKCNHICNNCNNSSNKNYNSNIDTNNNNMITNDNNDYAEDCDEDGGFENHIDYPIPIEEKIFDVDSLSPEEMTGNREFFCGNSAKTPERYLKIRNTIVDQWLKHKPKYLSKTSVRTGLKDCGDVNAIGRVHEFLERMGAINFGSDRPPRHRHPSTGHQLRLSPQPPTMTCTHSCQHHEAPCDEVMGTRKRRARTRTGDFEDEQPVTYEHKPEEGHEYEQRFAALNAKYFVEEDDVKKRLPRNKRTRFVSEARSDEDVAGYDPFRLIPCSRSLPPVVSTPSTASHSTSFTLSIQSTALIIMDMHAHMATTEVLGLLGGTYDVEARHMHIVVAVPCESTSSVVQCEMDPHSQVIAREGLAARGLLVVGWYHSHPAFPPCPSIRDIETQSLYQRVCTAPFVGVIVSPYDPRHPSDVSLFNYVIVGDEWSSNREYQVPYEVPRTVVSDLPTPAVFAQLVQIVEKHKNYKFRVDMNKMFRRGERITCLEKMLKSIAGHYFVSQVVSGDIQARLINKIRNLFRDKPGKTSNTDKSENENADASEKAKSTTGKRKKDLMQLHQQQQQQRIMQEKDYQHPILSEPSHTHEVFQHQSTQTQSIQLQTIQTDQKSQSAQVPIKIQQKQQQRQQHTHIQSLSVSITSSTQTLQSTQPSSPRPLPPSSPTLSSRAPPQEPAQLLPPAQRPIQPTTG